MSERAEPPSDTSRNLDNVETNAARSGTTAPPVSGREKETDPTRRRRILIVDDEPTYREYLDRFLTRDGLEVRTAETGAEAIKVSREFAPDILLADWMLRCEMHGIEVGEALRAQWPDLRILLMTGFPTADLQSEATRVGIDGFLEKPFSLDDLSSAIKDALASA